MNLFIDTSSNYIIFSLFNELSVVSSKIIETNRNQSEIFIDEFDLFLKENSYTLKDIDNYYFTKGPGSFTGVRVGLTFAKGLKVSGIENIYVVSSLEVLFDNYSDSQACIDARGNKYYYQEVKDGEFSKPILVDNLDISKCNSYDNSLSKITENIVSLVKQGRFSNKIESLYIKEAF